MPRTLPVVLSREEAARLIAAARNLKHQTALSVAYGTGLRASEVVALKVSDIDSQRMTLRVEQGKGRKDRYAMLPPLLLERLRTWWRVARAQGKMLDGGWLFPGLNPIDPLTPRQLNRAIHDAALRPASTSACRCIRLRHYAEFRTMPRLRCDALGRLLARFARHSLISLWGIRPSWKEVIMERFYKDPRTPLRMREGALGAYVDALAQQLSDEGYAQASGRHALQLVADFGRWLRRRGSDCVATYARTPSMLSGVSVASSTPSPGRCGDVAAAV